MGLARLRACADRVMFSSAGGGMSVRPMCGVCAAVAALLFIGMVVEAGAPHAEAGSRHDALSLEQLVSGWYQREFGVSFPRPAIFNDPRAVDCRGDGHLTTTAYLNRSGTTTDL